MSLQIFNSLSKKKEELIPQKDKVVKMYSCGVTVYDKCHIGHARSLYVFDVIRNYLKFRGFDVHFVRNITDIDDKIINKANELGVSSEEVSTQNVEDYYHDLELLGISKADSEPKATDNIPQMIDDIKGLIERDMAYAVDGDVYYRVRKFKNYGKLSGQSIENMMEGVRIEKDDKKEDPLDFALWKKSAEGESSWNSPWGEGRPGWHIECSCMSLRHLDCETLDIHAGGRDLIFPHHENEIAQAEGLSGNTFAKYWIHHGLLTINAQKMAKSAGNFITIEDAVKKYGAEVLKVFFLSSHYASPIDFNEEKIEDARKALERFEILFKEADMHMECNFKKDSKTPEFLNTFEKEFMEAMDDDFNTPRAWGSLFELLNETYKQKENEDYANILHMVNAIIRTLGRDIFGIFKDDKSLDAALEKLLNEREVARANKDFNRSDELRDELMKNGVIVEDTAQGQRWRMA